VGRRDPVHREIFAKDVTACGGEGKDLTIRMLYLPALLVAAVLLACAAALLALSEKAEATFPGKNGKIAYESNGVIYTINPNGSGKAKVTRGYQPAYSPDGKRIAYESNGVIYTTKVGGGGKRKVTNNNTNYTSDYNPSYSPSGEKIAYEEEHSSADTEICTIKVGGGGKFQVTHNDTGDFNPDYSPNGNRLVYEGFEGRIGYNPSDEASTNIYTIKVGGEGSSTSPKAAKTPSYQTPLLPTHPTGRRSPM
jgi:Tol biopolymer transport system component